MDLRTSWLNPGRQYAYRLGRRFGGWKPYILFSLDCAPPAIFWVRSWTSSCFSSSSCLRSSSLFLPQSCEALTLPDDCGCTPSACRLLLSLPLASHPIHAATIGDCVCVRTILAICVGC